jgi:hypothetical protein
LNPPASQPAVEEDLPSLWLGASSLIDLEDPKLRLRVRALTQLSKTERDKALAVYGFVKRMPLAKRMKLRLRTAREVIDSGHGDATDKATLLVAMLRAAGIPARLRYVLVDGDILRGLTTAIASAGRPVVEVFHDDKWRATDTYIFDAHYVAAARQRLRALKWEWGYGLHRRGHTLWDGLEDAYLTGDSTTAADISLGVLGHFHDPYDFLVSPVHRERFARMTRTVRWNMLAPKMNRAVTQLRQTGGGGHSSSFGTA